MQTDPAPEADTDLVTGDNRTADLRLAVLRNKPIKLRSVGGWSKVLECGKDTSIYYHQLKKCGHLHEWCNTKWGETHMQWDDFSNYVDSSLSTRVRLIYWLRRIWYTYHPDWGFHLPSSYDSLLKRYVRDFAQNDKWAAAGDPASSIDKWRALAPIFHHDQLELCSFYCKVDPSFMQKGLQADNHLSSSDAANILSLLVLGTEGWYDGALRTEKLRDIYTALLENRYRLDEENEKIAFFRRLRIGKVLGARARLKRSTRAKTLAKDCLDDNAGVPMLPPGTKTRSVINDCHGRVGIAKSTLHGAGEGGFALKAIKKNKPVGVYRGRHLKSKSEILEASRSSDYVFVCGEVAIDAKEAGACTMRFLNDCLDPALWNRNVKVVNGEVWIYSTMDIVAGQELFLPYGYLFWWKRRLTLSSTLIGQCARAYPEFSTRLNNGHEKHTFAEKLWSKKHNKPAPKIANNKKVGLADASMWAHFPSPRPKTV